MLLVGLTGGIGSGKSTVSRMLRQRGAVVLDADAFARAAVVAGSPGLRSVVARFGREILTPDGELDRPKLASIVFSDPAALADLEAIVHPEVRRMIAEGIQENLDEDRVVVLVNPLLIEMGTHRDCDVVVVVSASPETQVARSVERGMSENDVTVHFVRMGGVTHELAQHTYVPEPVVLVVGPARLLHDVRRGVEPEAADAEVEPEGGHLGDLVANHAVGDVQLGLERVEAMEVVPAGHLVPRPHVVLDAREHR